MLFSTIRRLGFLAVLGLGLWLISKIAAERADQRQLSRTSAPWPPVPLDGQDQAGPDPVPPADETQPTPVRIETSPNPVSIVADAGNEIEPDPIRARPQTVALARSGPVISLQLPRRETSEEPEPTGWIEPDGGSCPLDHPVKAKLTSHLYHEPGMANYRRTNADRCYVNGAGAEGDGFVRAKR